MKAMLVSLTALLTVGSSLSAGLAAPVAPRDGAIAASIPTRQVLEACVQNRAETLPNPFSDVPTHHWAYKAVVTLYYCGPYRQATPPALIEQLSGDTPNSEAPDAASPPPTQTSPPNP